MTKFHVGDRVRITQKDHLAEGDTGVVTNTDSGSNTYPYSVVFDEHNADVGDGDIFAEKDLRPADIFAQVDEDIADWAKKDISISDLSPAIVEAVDNVNHPPHYSKYPVEVIEITEQLDFNKGNAVKYILRAGHKAGVDELEDLSKAAWYVNRAIEKLKKERNV